VYCRIVGTWVPTVWQTVGQRGKLRRHISFIYLTITSSVCLFRRWSSDQLVPTCAQCEHVCNGKNVWRLYLTANVSLIVEQQIFRCANLSFNFTMVVDRKFSENNHDTQSHRLRHC